jgi:hypothetical protein
VSASPSRNSPKNLAFSKELDLHLAAVTWEDAYYNWVRSHKNLRAEVVNDPKRKWAHYTHTLAANLTDHI